jgi:hypothetical protein
VFESPIIYGLIATSDHLYAIGDFDRVLDWPGGSTFIAGGFARLSLETGRWESLGDPALDGAGYSGEVDWPAVFVGGDFTLVGSGSIASSRVAQAVFDVPVAAWETIGASSVLAPLELYEPQPNPSCATVQLGYMLPKGANVTLSIFDVSGRRVVQLVDDFQDPGEHAVQWERNTKSGRRASPGVYFARLTAGNVQVAKKIVLVE